MPVKSFLIYLREVLLPGFTPFTGNATFRIFRVYTPVFQRKFTIVIEDKEIRSIDALVPVSRIFIYLEGVMF